MTVSNSPMSLRSVRRSLTTDSVKTGTRTDSQSKDIFSVWPIRARTRDC